LLNLAANAVKFTENGAVTVILRQTAARFEILVRDTGIGMSEEQVAHLFIPFMQGDTSVTRQYGGTGLGLSITQRLIQIMGGEIMVESKLGVGSTFTLVLPLAAAPAASARRLALAS
jgi:signal transduction histidine kinase